MDVVGEARRFLAACLVLSIAFLPATTAFANPQGGRVAAGQAQIHETSPTRLDVTQQSGRAVINWKSFDIAPGETTHFEQPANAWTLNRVPDATQASQLLGTLSATANVAVINPSGVIIGDTGVIDAAGFLATTTNIPDADFMAGKLDFNLPGLAEGVVANRGTIRVRDGGFAALVAPWVENSGEIHATVGRVALASGDAFTLDFYGDGLIEFDVSHSAYARQISQAGQIFADGGAVAISVQETANIVESVINLDGLVQANRIEDVGGRIVLRGGPATQVEVRGELIALGDDAGESGGRIEVLGGEITLAETALLDASGDAGGGQIRIGGDFQGGEALLAAEDTAVEEGALVRANATRVGDAGDVAIWADGDTEFRGRVEASASTGRGGFVEVSGKDQLVYRGEVDVSGEAGGGKLLLDPTDVVIGSADETSTTILNTDLAAMLRAGTAVDLLADDSVTVNDEVDGRIFDGSGGDGNLSLRATAGDIVLNDDLLTRDGDITLSSEQGSIRMQAGDDDSFVTQGQGTELFSENGDISITTESATSRIDVAYVVTSGDILIESAGNVTTGITTGQGASARIVGLVDSRGPNAGATTGSIDITAGGDLLIDTDVASSQGDITISAGGVVDQFVQAAIDSDSGNVNVDAGTDALLADIDTSGDVSIQSGGATRAQGVIERRGPARGGDAIDIRAVGSVFVDARASLQAENDAISIASSAGGIEVSTDGASGVDDVMSPTGIEALAGDISLTAASDIESGFVNAGRTLTIDSSGGDVTIGGLTQAAATGANAVSVAGRSVLITDRIASDGDILITARAGDLVMDTGTGGREGQIRSEGGGLVTLRSFSSGGDDGDIEIRNVGTTAQITIDAERDLSIQGVLGRDANQAGTGLIDADAGRDVLFALGGLVRSGGQRVEIDAGRDLTIPFESGSPVATGVDARASAGAGGPDGAIDLSAGGTLRAAQLDGATIDLASTSGAIEVDGVLRSTATGGDLGVELRAQSIGFASTGEGEIQSANGASLTTLGGTLDTTAGAIFAGAGPLTLDAQTSTGDLVLGGELASQSSIDALAGRDLRVTGTLGNGEPDATTGGVVALSAVATGDLTVEAGGLLASSGGDVVLTSTAGAIQIAEALDTGVVAGTGDVTVSALDDVMLGNLESSGGVQASSTQGALTLGANSTIDGSGNSATANGGVGLSGFAGMSVLGNVLSDLDVTLRSAEGAISMVDAGAGAVGRIQSTQGAISIEALGANGDITTGELAAPGGISIRSGRDATVAGLIDVKSASATLVGLAIDASQDLFVNAEIQTVDADIDLDAGGMLEVTLIEAPSPADPANPAIATITTTGAGAIDLASGGDMTVRGSLLSESNGVGAGGISLVSSNDAFIALEREDPTANLDVAMLETGAGDILVQGGGVRFGADIVSESGDIVLRGLDTLNTVDRGSVRSVNTLGDPNLRDANLVAVSGDITVEAIKNAYISNVFSNGNLIVRVQGAPNEFSSAQIVGSERNTFNGQQFRFQSVRVDGPNVVISRLLETVGNVTVNADTAYFASDIVTSGGDISLSTTDRLILQRSLRSDGGAITLGSGQGGNIVVAPRSGSTVAEVSWVYETTEGLGVDSRSASTPGTGGDIRFLDEIVARPVESVFDSQLDIGTLKAREAGARESTNVDVNGVAVFVPIIESYEMSIAAGDGSVSFTGDNLFDVLDIQSASRIGSETPSSANLDAYQVKGVLLGQEATGAVYTRALVEDDRDGNANGPGGRENPVSEELPRDFEFRGVVETDQAPSCSGGACEILAANFFSDGIEPYPYDPGLTDDTLQAFTANEMVEAFGGPGQDIPVPPQTPQIEDDFLTTNATILIDADAAGQVTRGYGTSVSTPAVALESLTVTLRDTPSPVNPFVFTGVDFIDRSPQPNARDLPPGATDLPGFFDDIPRTDVGSDIRDVNVAGIDFQGGFDSAADLALFGSLDDAGSVAITGNADSAANPPSVPGSEGLPTPEGGSDGSDPETTTGGVTEGERFARQQEDDDEDASDEEEEEELASNCPTDIPSTYQTTPSRAAFGSSILGNPYTIDTFCGDYELVTAPRQDAPAYRSLSFVESDFWTDRRRAETPSPLLPEALPEVATEGR